MYKYIVKLLLVVVLTTACSGYKYPEIERSEEFDLIYDTVLYLYEGVRKPIDDECLYYTRRVLIKWRDHPKHIGHYNSGWTNSKKANIILDDRLRKEQLIRTIAHELIHGFEFCMYDENETLGAHGDPRLWANGGADFKLDTEDENIKKDSVLYQATEILMKNEDLVEWSKHAGKNRDLMYSNKNIIENEEYDFEKENN